MAVLPSRAQLIDQLSSSSDDDMIRYWMLLSNLGRISFSRDVRVVLIVAIKPSVPCMSRVY